MNEREKALTDWLEKHDAVEISRLNQYGWEYRHYLLRDIKQAVIIHIIDTNIFSWDIYIQPSLSGSIEITLTAADRILATNG